jgi:hypothetical protein
VNRKYCILLMHNYYGKVWWCQFGLTAIKKNEKKQTRYMTKKLFCQLNHEYLPLQYFGDGFNKIGKNDKKKSYLTWIAVLFLNSFSHDISHIQVLNWSMPRSKKHVYLEKNKWLNFNIFFLIFCNFLKDAGDSTFNQNLRQLTMFLFIAII